MDHVENLISPDAKKYQLISELLALSQENPSSTPDSPSHPLESHSLVQKRTKEIDQLAIQLRRERITLLRQRNRYQSPICKLPPETLVEILAYTVPDFDPHTPDVENRRRLPPTKLAAVSAFFREVVFATPRLWASISLQMPFWLSSSGELVLALYFKNVQKMGLSIEIDGLVLDNALSGNNAIHEAEIFNLIFNANIMKVRGLRLMPLSKTWTPRISTIRRSRFFPNLKECFISYGPNSDPNNSLVIQDSPRLEKIAIVCGTSSRVFPWTQIKYLELLNTESTICLNILIQCPNLISLRLLHPQRKNNRPAFTDLLTSETTFEHLRSLYLSSVISDGSNDWALALCQRLHFPAVQRLVWNGRSRAQQTQESLCSQILPRLPNLRTFCFSWSDGPYSLQEIKELFSNCTNVSDMMIIFADIRTFQPDLFSVLTVTGDGEQNNLPSLKRLTLHISGSNTSYMLAAEHDLLDMLRSRQTAGITKLGHIKIILRTRDECTTNYYKGLLRRINEVGVQVSLVED